MMPSMMIGESYMGFFNDKGGGCMYYNLDFGEMLTRLIISDYEFYNSLLQAQREARGGIYLTHEDVFEKECRNQTMEE